MKGDRILKLGNIEGCNNKLLNAGTNGKIGVTNQYINIVQKMVHITKRNHRTR